MDMNWSTICVYPSFTTRWATLFLLAYPIFVWVMAVNRRDESGPMSASAVPATLTPLLVAAAVSWLGLGQVLEGISRHGGGRAATSAGIAEAIGMITLGSLIAAIVASLSWLRDRITRALVSRMPATKRTIVAAVISFAVCVSLLVAEAFVADGIREFSPITLYTAAAVSALGAIASLIWLIASRRVPSLQIDNARAVVAACCAAASILLCYASWYVARVYTEIAIHG